MTTRSVPTSAARASGRLRDALMGGNEILPLLARVNDLRRGPDLGEIAAFAEAERVLPRLYQPDRVGKQPPQPDDGQVGGDQVFLRAVVELAGRHLDRGVMHPVAAAEAREALALGHRLAVLRRQPQPAVARLRSPDRGVDSPARALPGDGPAGPWRELE